MPGWASYVSEHKPAVEFEKVTDLPLREFDQRGFLGVAFTGENKASTAHTTVTTASLALYRWTLPGKNGSTPFPKFCYCQNRSDSQRGAQVAEQLLPSSDKVHAYKI